MPSIDSEETLDDLLRAAIERVLRDGKSVLATRGRNTELTAALLELRNPRARASRSLTRGRFFSPLGELCWYLAGSDAESFVAYYIAQYRKEAELGRIPGAYGPRLFGAEAQIERVCNLLREKPSSRRAVVTVLRVSDLEASGKELPCTIALQFLIRDGFLDMMAFMRSSDLILGAVHDIFCFTMFQEMVAVDLGIGLGTYTHIAGSLHIYDDHRDDAKAFLGEPWSATLEMPPMPAGPPWRGIVELLRVEKSIREGENTIARYSTEPYWADLERMLKAFALARQRDRDGLAIVRDELTSPFYHLYVDDRTVDMTARDTGDRE